MITILRQKYEKLVETILKPYRITDKISPTIDVMEIHRNIVSIAKEIKELREKLREGDCI